MRQEERWHPVIGYEGLYEISTAGRVFSIERKKYIKPYALYGKHNIVSLYKDGEGKCYAVDRLVENAFCQ